MGGGIRLWADSGHMPVVATECDVCCVQERSRSALLRICWMVSCDYSPHRQKKEGEISSPVVSELHTVH